MQTYEKVIEFVSAVYLMRSDDIEFEMVLHKIEVICSNIFNFRYLILISKRNKTSNNLGNRPYSSFESTFPDPNLK